MTDEDVTNRVVRGMTLSAIKDAVEKKALTISALLPAFIAKWRKPHDIHLQITVIQVIAGSAQGSCTHGNLNPCSRNPVLSLRSDVRN